MPHVAAPDAMTPLERLLNLVGLLLETKRPLPFEEIKEILEPYRQENRESAKRMFERDKDALREFGVPLEMVDVDAWGTEQGYLIPKEKYYLPDISFTPEELGALLVAAQSGARDTPAEQGVRKLLTGAAGGVLGELAGGPLASGGDADSSLVVACADAAARRRHLRFGYRTSQGTAADRDVDAYAVVYRGGHWYLVGHDRERDAVRAFRLSRFTGAVRDEGEGSERPEGFRATDHVQGGPWAMETEDRATVAVEPEAVWLARSTLAGAQVEGTRDDGRVELSIPVPDQGAVASLVMQLGPAAEILEPASLRREILRRLEAIGA
jgi:proteasome accessory factor B